MLNNQLTTPAFADLFVIVLTTAEAMAGKQTPAFGNLSVIVLTTAEVMAG